MKNLAVLAAILMACGDDGSPAVDAAVGMPDAPVEACTGGVDEDADAFTDCDDDDCWDDPACYQIDDPTDLPAPNGDPSVDIDKARVTLVGGVATFYVTFDAGWPPPATVYRWEVRFEIANDGNSPIAGLTLQRESTTYLGDSSAASVSVRQSAVGVWARITNVASTGEKYYVETAIQRTDPGTRVADTVVDAPAPLP